MANNVKGARLTTLVGLALISILPQAAQAAPTTLENVVDRLQIEDLEKQYYSELKGGSVQGIGAYFTENATMVFNGNKVEGRAAIDKFYASGGDRRVLPTNAYTMILSNMRTSVNGNTAVFDAIWTGYLCDNVKSTPRLVEQGTDRTVLEKQNGVWKISSRTVQHLGGG